MLLKWKSKLMEDAYDTLVRGFEYPWFSMDIYEDIHNGIRNSIGIFKIFREFSQMEPTE